MPNFVKIGQSVAKILRFFRFLKMAAAAILDCRIHKILLADSVRSAQTHHSIKFHQNRSLHCCNIVILPPPFWIFEIVNFYLLTVTGGTRRITVPNLIKIGRSVTEILRFFEFLTWPPPPSWIFVIAKFYSLLRS